MGLGLLPFREVSRAVSGGGSSRFEHTRLFKADLGAAFKTRSARTRSELAQGGGKPGRKLGLPRLGDRRMHVDFS